MSNIQTCGSRDSLTDEFTFSMCFGDSPALTFEGLTREQVINLRDCLECMLWEESESDYPEVLGHVRDTIGPYVSVTDEKDASREVIETIKALLSRKVDYSGDPEGILHWHDVEAMLVPPLG